MTDGISFTALLQYTTDETCRWRQWFRNQPPAVLEVPLGEPGTETATLRGMLVHIFYCELFYSDLLRDVKPDFPAYEKIPHTTLQELFELGADAESRLGSFAAQADGAALDAITCIGWPPEKPISGSKRKLLAHVLLHSVRHWAQVATALRQHGYKAEWGHDLLFTTALA